MVVTDQLPPQVQYLSKADSPHIASSSYDSATHTVTFNFSDPIASGATGELLINVRFPVGTWTGTEAFNNATMSGGGISSPITTTPDVKVTATNGTSPPTISNGVDIYKSDSTSGLYLGPLSRMYYYIRHGTLGGEELTNYVVEDFFPKEFIFEHWRHQRPFLGSTTFEVYYQKRLTDGTITG